MHKRDYVEIDYTNWRGERRKRLVRVIEFWFGKSAWHPEEQWLMRAFCVESGEDRDFAVTGLHGFTPVKGTSQGIVSL